MGCIESKKQKAFDYEVDLSSHTKMVQQPRINVPRTRMLPKGRTACIENEPKENPLLVSDLNGDPLGQSILVVHDSGEEDGQEVIDNRPGSFAIKRAE